MYQKKSTWIQDISRYSKIHKMRQNKVWNITTPFISSIVSDWEMLMPAFLEHAGNFQSITISHSWTWYRSMRSMVVILRSSSTCNWPNLSMYKGRPILSVLWWKCGYNSLIASLSGNWKVCYTQKKNTHTHQHRIRMLSWNGKLFLDLVRYTRNPKCSTFASLLEDTRKIVRTFFIFCFAQESMHD